MASGTLRTSEKMKMKIGLKISLYTVLMVFALSCQNSKNDISQKLFRFDTFFEQQISHLKNSKKNLVKTVELGNNTETKQIPTPDWDKELAHFKELNFNKPAFESMYQLVQKSDTETYVLKPNEKANIKSISTQKESKWQSKKY